MENIYKDLFFKGYSDSCNKGLTSNKKALADVFLPVICCNIIYISVKYNRLLFFVWYPMEMGLYIIVSRVMYIFFVYISPKYN